MRPAPEDIGAYEGLVFKTAELFASMVGMEAEDCRQELRIKVVKARRAYDPTRSKMTERAYVYACLANFVKDLKRHAARRSVVHIVHIADEKVDALEFRFNSSCEVDEAIEDEGLFLPSTINPDERRVLLLLMHGYAQFEIATILGLNPWQVTERVKSLRDKLADWKPSSGDPLPALVAA